MTVHVNVANVSMYGIERVMAVIIMNVHEIL